jgi:hypothetical protein
MLDQPHIELLLKLHVPQSDSSELSGQSCMKSHTDVISIHFGGFDSLHLNKPPEQGFAVVTGGVIVVTFGNPFDSMHCSENDMSSIPIYPYPSSVS